MLALKKDFLAETLQEYPVRPSSHTVVNFFTLYCTLCFLINTEKGKDFYRNFHLENKVFKFFTSHNTSLAKMTLQLP